MGRETIFFDAKFSLPKPLLSLQRPKGWSPSGLWRWGLVLVSWVVGLRDWERFQEWLCRAFRVWLTEEGFWDDDEMALMSISCVAYVKG